MEVYQVQSDPHESFDPYLLAGLAVRELNAHDYRAEVLPGTPARISTDKLIDKYLRSKDRSIFFRKAKLSEDSRKQSFLRVARMQNIINDKSYDVRSTSVSSS